MKLIIKKKDGNDVVLLLKSMTSFYDSEAHGHKVKRVVYSGHHVFAELEADKPTLMVNIRTDGLALLPPAYRSYARLALETLGFMTAEESAADVSACCAYEEAKDEKTEVARTIGHLKASMIDVPAALITRYEELKNLKAPVSTLIFEA